MATVTPGVGSLTLTGFAPVLVNTTPTTVASDALYAVVAVSSAGDNTLVAAVSGQRVRVLALTLVASGGANTVQLCSGAGAVVPISGAEDLASDGQLVLPYNPAGWGQTGIGEPLTLVLTNAAEVAGMLTYVMMA